MTILAACQMCTAQAAPERVEPAESTLAIRCPSCLAETTLTVCVMHTVEVHGLEAEGRLHCALCHKHPARTCVAVTVASETPL